MTKHIRIENADTSDQKARVFVERKNGDGVWLRDEGIPPAELNFPTAMTIGMIHGTQRLVIEEVQVPT